MPKKIKKEEDEEIFKKIENKIKNQILKESKKKFMEEIKLIEEQNKFFDILVKSDSEAYKQYNKIIKMRKDMSQASSGSQKSGEGSQKSGGAGSGGPPSPPFDSPGSPDMLPLLIDVEGVVKIESPWLAKTQSNEPKHFSTSYPLEYKCDDGIFGWEARKHPLPSIRAMERGYTGEIISFSWKWKIKKTGLHLFKGNTSWYSYPLFKVGLIYWLDGHGLWGSDAKLKVTFNMANTLFKPGERYPEHLDRYETELVNETQYSAIQTHNKITKWLPSTLPTMFNAEVGDIFIHDIYLDISMWINEHGDIDLIIDEFYQPCNFDWNITRNLAFVESYP